MTKQSDQCPKCGCYLTFPVKGFGNKKYGMRECSDCKLVFDPKHPSGRQTKLEEVLK